MQVITQKEPLQQLLHEMRSRRETIGLVPTMGAFHEGHLALIRLAKSENDRVVVTLFVNPAQFTETEDYEKYPRDSARDKKLAEESGADILFVPTVDQMYPTGFDTVVAARGLSERLEGISRPGHFQGVATVVTKLLNIVGADRAYFGEKDRQQLEVIRQIVRDLDMPTQIVGMPTVREPDGLAMSSRNVRLTPDQRQAAVVLSQALDNAQAIADSGFQNANQIATRLRQIIEEQPLASVDYAVVVHPETLQEIDTMENGALAAVAVNFGKVRLIDNRLLRAIPSQANSL